MKRHNITLSDPLSALVRTQVAGGRYKDFSAAMQDAAWNFFFGATNPFEEYKVTEEEVDRAATRETAAIARARKSGKLVPFK